MTENTKMNTNCVGRIDRIDRNNILSALVPYFEKDPKYFLLLNDSGFGKTEEIQKLFPPRVFNLGIMEQATVGIASGMAQSGLIPVVYSIAAFLVFRAYEQIRVDVVLRNQNVKLIGNGSGDYFRFLDPCHCCSNQEDRRALEVIGLPVYTGDQFQEWIESDRGGYIIC